MSVCEYITYGETYRIDEPGKEAESSFEEVERNSVMSRIKRKLVYSSGE